MLKPLLLGYTLLFAASCFGFERDSESKQPEAESETTPKDMSLADNAAVPLSTVPVASEELVCRRERVTGTHISKKVCRTKSQLEADRIEAENYMRRMKIAPSALPAEGN